MDNNMIWRFRVLAEQVFRVAQILADHEDILSENEVIDLECVKDTLKDCFDVVE